MTLATPPRKKTATKKPATRGPNGRAASRKPASNRRKPDAANGPPSLTLAHIQGFGVGITAGLLFGVVGFAWLTNPNAPVVTEVVENFQSTSENDSQPRFDFYTVLPSQTLDLTSDVEPPDFEGSARNDLYVLQAGSFRAQKDADRRLGELVLLGLEPTIEQTEGDNGAWFRVYLGPFDSRSKMAQASSITAQQSIDTLLLRRPRSP